MADVEGRHPWLLGGYWEFLASGGYEVPSVDVGWRLKEDIKYTQMSIACE